VASFVQTDAVGGNPTAVKTRTGFLSSPKAEPPIKVSTCPLASTISPCTCEIEPSDGAQIECSYFTVNESSIENTFREIRRVNGIPEDRGIEIYQFKLEFTELTQLDLAPFYGSQFDYLFIMFNDDLTKLVTSGNPRDHGSIQALELIFVSSPLSRIGFGDAFKYFSNEMTSFSTESLNLNDDEFLPGLSAHTNLRDLICYSCSISGRLTSDTLIPKELQNLGRIELYRNYINEIGENVFNLDGSGDFEGVNHVLYINLGGNKLNETSFHPNSGIARAGRKTTLFLEDNQITTLPAPIFESFLDAHPQNSLGLGLGNPLICDERLSWLKSRRGEFEPRVTKVKCSNDRSHTIFDSNLIP